MSKGANISYSCKRLFEGKVLQRTNRPKYTGWENGWNESFGPKTWPFFGAIFGGWPKFCVDGWLWWLTPQTPNLRRPQRKTPSLEAKRGIFRLERPVSPIFPLCIMLNKSEDGKNYLQNLTFYTRRLQAPLYHIQTCAMCTKQKNKVLVNSNILYETKLSTINRTILTWIAADKHVLSREEFEPCLVHVLGRRQGGGCNIVKFDNYFSIRYKLNQLQDIQVWKIEEEKLPGNEEGAKGFWELPGPTLWDPALCNKNAI